MIVCHDLTRDFGSVRALDHLSLEVPDGAIFAFLGPNGAGKTTTIHLLLGIIEPTSGSARVAGLDPTTDGPAVRRACGALLEHTGHYERLSAEDNLRFYARIAHLGEDETNERIAAVLTRFGLYERRGDPVVTWSRGMKQKLAIARALLAKPSVVFLDEPTAGLDPEATVALRRDIAALGTTVFLTTHNLTDVEKTATHVAVIRQGQLLDFGTPAELRARAVRSHVTIRMRMREPMQLELAADESVAPIVTKLVREGAEIEEVRREEPSLEDVFLHLVKKDTPTPPPPRAMLSPAAEKGGGERRPVFRDIATVIRKEWREITSAAGSGSTTRANVIIGIGLLVIVAALAAYLGPRLIASPAVMISTMIAFLVLLASVGDAFPGERERHTLETLLASALPDEALILGKVLASVLYGWLAMLILLATLLLGANVTSPGTIYPPSTLLGALVLTPLMLLFFSSAGMLVTMHAPTVRASQPRLMALFFGLFIPLVAIRPFIPEAWKDRANAMLQTESGRVSAIAAQIAFFAVLDLVLLAVALARFKRSRLL